MKYEGREKGRGKRQGRTTRYAIRATILRSFVVEESFELAGTDLVLRLTLPTDETTVTITSLCGFTQRQ